MRTPASDPRVIVALDFASAKQALALAAQLNPTLCRLKVGLELYTAAGPDVVTRLVADGFDVFLDLKYHDIPNTVAMACAHAAALGVWMLNVHALGGRRMLVAAKEAVVAARRPPRLIAVTILTSHAGGELSAIGLPGDTQTHVQALAQLADDAGLDGVVCSPHEAASLRASLGPGFTLVTPGIRAQALAGDDQSRTLTARQAVAAGADYIVIGRPITRAPDPVAALMAVNAELGCA